MIIFVNSLSLFECVACLIWSTKGPLLDIQEFSGGQDLFLRLASAELGENVYAPFF